jgi:hypothetical protein
MSGHKGHEHATCDRLGITRACIAFRLIDTFGSRFLREHGAIWLAEQER